MIDISFDDDSDIVTNNVYEIITSNSMKTVANNFMNMLTQRSEIV